MDGHVLRAAAMLAALACGCHRSLPASAPATTAAAPADGRTAADSAARAGATAGPAAPAAGAATSRTSAPATWAGATTRPAAASAAAPEPALREKPLIHAEEDKSGRGELELRIDRMWTENGFTWAQVHVRNTSPYELEEITIRCTAFGQGSVNLDFREQTLLTRSDGRMVPGFQKTLTIRLERGGFAVREMSCNARGW